MVEKIIFSREAYQKHSRNISTISDLSMCNADPLKRDENAEIRCVLLCDSETERHCVFEAFQKLVCDGQSSVQNPELLHHHWEQPHNECNGVDCRYCLRIFSYNNVAGDHGNGGAVGVANAAASSGVAFNAMAAAANPVPLLITPSYLNDGYFRFMVGGSVFRLLLMSKDKQNLLKIISYDFLFVGVQVTDCPGMLDEHIWEYEWKRLERHSRKAVAPIILFGYFRDVLKLGHSGDISLDRIIEESKQCVRKAGSAHRAIPRFCDFVTGNSGQVWDIFSDVEKLYKHPGFVLQQCALNNAITHFTSIIENPNLTKEDLCYKSDDELGDNPIMIAAKLRHKDIVSSVLRSNRFQASENNEFLSTLIHEQNLANQTLLAMVALQGPELEEQKLLILRKEIQLHCVSDITHEADQLKLQRCLRSQLKSSAEAAIILSQVWALQGIPKTERELKAERGKVWSRLFFASLLLSLVFNAIDTGSDILIMIRYYGELVGKSMASSNESCGDEALEDVEPPNCNVSSSSGELISIQCFPTALSPESKFGYTLFFIVVPWPFFIYEFFTSRNYHQLVAKGGEIVAELAACSGLASLAKNYLKAILYCVLFVSCLLFWPIAVLFIKYYNDGKYYLAKGAQKVAREKKIEMSEVLFSTARVMEVSLESSFQPTIQLYILFPVLVREMTARSFSLRIFTVCKNDDLNFPILKTDQTISIITSILSLAWCFTYYHAALKRGALDKDLAALFYRSVLFLSVLFQILGRLFILVLFSYSFGPGLYFPLLIFLAAHILLMTVLHFIFSDAKVYWQKGGFLNLSFFHYMIGNGLANIYIHNWIKMDPLLIPFTKPLQHVSTLMRQLMFDLVFVAENLTLLVIALNSNIKELREHSLNFAVILMGFTIVGLVLKCVYYRYLHIWAWLIMDYITKKEDGHWKCLLFSNMYFMGELKERELLLCCIPGPVFRLINYLFGDRYFKSTETSCSRCTAVFSMILIPIVFVAALAVLVLVVTAVVLFLPIFLVFVLPCVCLVRCRQRRDGTGGGCNVVKIVDDPDSRNMEEEGCPLTRHHHHDDDDKFYNLADNGDVVQKAKPESPQDEADRKVASPVSPGGEVVVVERGRRKQVEEVGVPPKADPEAYHDAAENGTLDEEDEAEDDLDDHHHHQDPGSLKLMQRSAKNSSRSFVHI